MCCFQPPPQQKQLPEATTEESCSQLPPQQQQEAAFEESYAQQPPQQQPKTTAEEGCLQPPALQQQDATSEESCSQPLPPQRQEVTAEESCFQPPPPQRQEAATEESDSQQPPPQQQPNATAEESCLQPPSRQQRRDAFDQYIDDCDSMASNVPTSLLRAVVSAPTKLGAFFGEVIDGHEGGVTMPTLGRWSDRKRDLLPLPCTPEAGEASISPLHAHCSEPWLSRRRAWVLLMIMTLNYQYGSTRRVVRGPPSRSQSLAIGLLGQAADILLERYR